MATKNKRLFTVTDLGGGDGGKGGVVHKIVEQTGAHTVVKVGGAQGSHGVRTSRGESFAFSQFGCGVFNGAATHISPLMVIDPVGLVREGELLRTQWRIDNVFNTMTVDQNALAITPYHGIASRLRELSRRGNPRGTIGVGVGVAYRDSLLYPELAIRAKDLNAPDIFDRIQRVREHIAHGLAPIIDDGFDEADREHAEENIRLLNAPELPYWTVDRFAEMVTHVRVVDNDFLRRHILSRDGTVVVESSHGVLTDAYYGFVPHTSKLRTLPKFTHELIRSCDYDGAVHRLGVHRAYQIRHGAGPMVTHDPAMSESLLPGSNKDENRWQGKVRVGAIDFVALRYAVEVCGGSDAFDGIALTWFDQIVRNGRWDTCSRYLGTDPEFFDGDDIIVRREEDRDQLDHQARLSQALLRCTPLIDHRGIEGLGRETLIALCDDVIRKSLGIPLRMISFGPTEREKVCL